MPLQEITTEVMALKHGVTPSEMVEVYASDFTELMEATRLVFGRLFEIGVSTLGGCSQSVLHDLLDVCEG